MTFDFAKAIRCGDCGVPYSARHGTYYRNCRCDEPDVEQLDEAADFFAPPGTNEKGREPHA